tara:strand:+ start:30 stop:308 length:279 start_codon:yes stop_codon:yes gene_type:complete
VWILLAVVLKTTNPGVSIPVLDKPLIHNTQLECEKSMKSIYDEYKLLQVNYPVKVKYEKNDNNQKYMVYTYKPDYTKPKITTYYYCLKTFVK